MKRSGEPKVFLHMKKTILSFLSSLKLTIVLLIIIAAFSILGTVIPQQYGAGESFTHMSPGLVKTFRSLQLLDLYHSVWFIVLMCLLSLNLIACSVKRFPASWKLFRATPSLVRSKPFEDLAPENILMIEGERRAITSRVEHILMKRYKRFRRRDTDTTSTFYGEKGPYSHFGVYVVHASILIIIAGAIIGSLWGFEGFVNLAEGESTDKVYVGGQKSLRELGYAVQCDKFSITYYDNGMPKEYRSDLSFFENNAVIFQGPLLVNHPVTINGIKFYQATYGTIPGGRAQITITEGNDKTTALTVNVKDSFYLKENGARVTVQRIEGNFMSMGPAVLLSIHSSETNMQLWVFKDIEKMKQLIPNLLQKVPKFNPALFEPYYFKLNSIAQTYYTGLQVSHDPGVSVVAIGAFFIVIGFFFTFFSSHKRLWVRVDEQEGKTRIMVRARSDRDPVGLERETQHLLRRFRKG
jgi:cytochrome c biogenesis protein